MNLVADESVHAAIINRLRADGHTVRAIRDTDGGAPDPAVLGVAVGERAVLLTQDKDFGELVVRLGMAHCGVVLIRLAGLSADDRARIVSEAVHKHEAELSASVTVITPAGVRIRSSDPGGPP